MPITFSEVVDALSAELETAIAVNADSDQSFGVLFRQFQQLAYIRLAAAVLSGGGGSGGSSGGGITQSQVESAIEAAQNLADILAKLEQIRTHVDGIEPTMLIGLLERIAGQVRQAAAVNTNASIAAGGTVQTAVSANPSRLYLEIVNYSSSDLWIRFDGDAAIDAGFKISSGQSWYNPPQFCPTGAVTIFGETTGQKYAIVEG